MIRALPYIFALFVLPQVVFAEIHYVPYNARTVLNLEDGDTISLTGFPTDWTYSRVVLGINSTPSVQMSGNITINNCKHTLYSFYQEIAFAYTNEIKIKYSGSNQQRMPIHWWVDSKNIFSKCKKTELTKKDTIWQLVYNFADSLYETKIANYQDLDTINTETLFEGSSHVFKITKLPTWKYNRIHVLIEPQDGRELNGYAFIGKKKTHIGGWTSTVVISQKTKKSPYFEVAFPEYRKVRIKWWVTDEQPIENQVHSSVQNLEHDSLLVNYEFGKTPYSPNSVRLKFDRNAFANGTPPIIKKLSFNPHGPENIEELAVMGDVFDIQAQLKTGHSVTLALPLDFDYVKGRDTVTIGHFIESENRWVEESVDSIANGYAYFKASTFSLRSLFRKSCKVVNTVAIVVAAPAVGIAAIFSEDVREGIETVASGWADIQTGTVNGIVDGVYWIYDLYNELRCFDFDGVRDRFKRLFRDPKSDSWEFPEQGKLSGVSHWDPTYIETLKTISTGTLTSKESAIAHCTSSPEESCNRQEYAWMVTSQNLDIFLADAILAISNIKDDNGNTITRRFKFSNTSGELVFEDVNNPNMGKMNFTDYFLTNSGMISDASWVVRGLEGCYNATNITGTILTNWIEWGKSIYNLDYQDFCKRVAYAYGHNEGYLNDVVECGEFLVNWNSVRYFFDSHAGKLQEISNAMVRVSLLAWIDATEFRPFVKDAYKSVYDGVRAWLELAGPMFLENNIVAKAYASLALYEFIYYGTHENLDYLNSSLKAHYGENGGYSEGTGYSQYIWDDVPYILSALQDAYKSMNKEMPSIENKFLRSPYYMAEFSRPVSNYGYIPVEIDDGCTYNPDYRVWAKLTGEPIFLKWSEIHPLKSEDKKITTLTAFGFPDESIYEAIPSSLPQKTGVWGSFKDGIGIITAIVSDDTISLSMIAEDGKQWKNGQNHDQQDNLSITLSSSNYGFIIQDRGYSGFETRKNGDQFHHHARHNVLTIGSNCNKSSPNESCIDFRAQRDNHIIDVNEIRGRAEEFSGNVSGVFWSLLAFFGVHLDLLGDDFKVEGGSEAKLLDSLKNTDANSKGYTAIHLLTKYDENGNTSAIICHRSILFFGGSFWVVDRPSEQGLVWIANSPRINWTDLGIHLYGSSQNDLGLDAQSVPRNIPQNSSRSDYPEPDKMLANNWFAIQDNDAKTYVMIYPVNGEDFTKTSENCPEGFQCFENIEKNKRLIIPPYGKKYKASSVLGRFSGFPELNGIMLATRNEKKIWEYDVLDGETFGEYEYAPDLPALRTLLLR